MPAPALISSSARSTPSRVSVPNVESGPDSERYAPMTIESSVFPLHPPHATEPIDSARMVPRMVRRASMDREIAWDSFVLLFLLRIRPLEHRDKRIGVEKVLGA